MSESSHPYGIAPDGFRLPDETSVGRVRLRVASLSRSLDYYEGVIGLHLHSRSADHAELGAPDQGEVLVELREQRNVQPAPRRGALGLFHFAILLPERAALGRFLRHALERGAVSGLSDHAVSEAVYLTDPDGLGIEVYADRPRSTWRVKSNRELHVTTEPLDVDGLIAGGSGMAWTGVPSSTRMGHIHLHVGDLNEAEDFYHRGLGFDKIAWSYPGALFFSAGGYHHHLGANTWSTGRAPAADQARLLSWDLETATPEAAARSLRASGYEVAPDGDRWNASDPWGTVVAVRPFRHRGSP